MQQELFSCEKEWEHVSKVFWKRFDFESWEDEYWNLSLFFLKSLLNIQANLDGLTKRFVYAQDTNVQSFVYHRKGKNKKGLVTASFL